MPLAFVTSFKLAAWTPKYLIVPLVAAAGVCVTPSVLRGRSRATARRPALLALLFAGWAALATLAAPDRNVALWGRYSTGTGLVFVLALVGAWMLGVSMRPAAAGLLERTLLAACVVSALVALVQQVTDLSSYGLALYQGRSAALYGNPVYLAELLAGGIWLAVCRLRRERPVGAALALLVLSAGMAVTGSRFGLALSVLAALLAWMRLARTRAATATLFIAVGLGLGTVLASSSPYGTSTTSVSRVEAAPASGLTPRLETWRAAATAVAARPLLGWGPSGFLAATSAHRTLKLAKAEGPDRLFADAHDMIIEYAVTTGLPGVALLAAWLAIAVRRSRNDALLGFAGFVVALTLLEPLHVGVTPLALLALGGAAAAGVEGERSPWVWRAVGAVAVTAALGAVVTLGLGFIRLRHAELDASPASARHAVALLPGWWQPAQTVGCLLSFADLSRPGGTPRGETIDWYATAARRDQQDPEPWTDLAGIERSAGDLNGASLALQHALTRDPWSQRALLGLARVDRQLGRVGEATSLERRAAMLGSSSTAIGGCQ